MSITENEALEILNTECEDISKIQIALKVARKALEEIHRQKTKVGMFVTLEERAMISERFARLEKYQSIGTIEELQDLKENQHKCEDCAGCTVWKCDCANERAYAIDEFAEKMCDRSCEESFRAIINSVPVDILTQDAVADLVWEVAEQMKKGSEENE